MKDSRLRRIHAESQVPFPSTNSTLSPAASDHARAVETSKQVYLSENGFSLLPGRMHKPVSSNSKDYHFYSGYPRYKTAFPPQESLVPQYGPATAKAADHLHQHWQKNIVKGTALKDTSNRSTIILHVSILKPSDLISWPAKQEQKTGLSLHAVPRHLPKLLVSSVTSVYTLASICFCVIGGFFCNWQDGFFILVWVLFFFASM